MTKPERAEGASHGAASGKPLRELDEREFELRYGCDRFTAALLTNRFRYVLDHVGAKLMTSAFSLVIRDMMDFCVTMSGPPEIGWPMPAVSLSNPIHWGPVPDSVRVVLEEYGVERLRPGDLIMANDSFRTGKHLNDVSFIAPMFSDGRLVTALHITAHQLDLGSRTPGGFDIASRTLWEDGLVLPPMLLYREGQLDKTVFNLVGANTRFPDIVLPDLEVIKTSLDLGQRLLSDSIAKYGLSAYLGAMRYACDGAAERMAEATAALPDGVYEAVEVLDGDGLADSPEYQLCVRIAKSGPRLEFDFSGSSEQTRSALNCSWLDVKTGVLLGLKALLEPVQAPNSGTLRNVDLLLPPGSILNPQPPAATMFYPELVEAIIQATIRALNPALGERAIAPPSWWIFLHHAQGRTASGDPWASLAVASSIPAQAWGGTQEGDGDSNSLLFWANFMDNRIEPREAALPMIVLRHEPMRDTAGPGRHRGGAGVVTDIYWKHAGAHQGFATHIKRAQSGAYGGGEGHLGGAWLLHAEGAPAGAEAWPQAAMHDPLYRESVPITGKVDPSTHEVKTDGEYVFRTEPISAGPGAIVRQVGCGAGGWGNPFDRAPDAVLRDVRDGYVSQAAAERAYGVVVVGDPEHDPEGLRIDERRTARLRSTARS